METINQFEVFLTAVNTIKMPVGATILSVDNHDNAIKLSAIVYSNKKTEDRVFELSGSGLGSPLQRLTPDTKRVYVGSVQLSGITWHLFEIV